MMRTRYSLSIYAAVTCGICLFFFSENRGYAQSGKLYEDIPEVAAKIKNLAAHTGLMLGRFKVMPENAVKYHYAFKKGPGRRDYGNKMLYAPDRGTAVYCGANHQSPHRLNDVWEFHLGSNTWHLVCPPGNDAARLIGWEGKARKARKEIEAGKNVEKNKAFLAGPYAQYLKKWWANCEVKNGYLQDKANGGPVMPWHTWDGVTYDSKSHRLYWAVLDSDNFKDEKYREHRNKVRTYAKATGQDVEKLLARIKPGTSMYIFDFKKKRWTKQMGKGPFPIMRAMGATLDYIPDIDKTIWYACVGCTPGGYNEGMWAYDANTNRWSNLMPGGTVAALMRKKCAPGEEIQAAYSVKHKKLVVVNGTMTFVYDVPSNKWKRMADNPGHGHDSGSVFDYDSKADRFILISKPGGNWSTKPYTVCAYNVADDRWNVLPIKGDAIPKDNPKAAWTWEGYSGYYDPGYNAFVLYCGRSARTWVYRVKK